MLLSFGGQTALNCGLELERMGVFKQYGVTVLGTPIKAIEDTEDRQLFKQRLDEIDVKTALSHAVNSVVEAIEKANAIGFPVMARSGFALGGLGSGVCQNEDELRELASKAFAHVPQILIEECWI